MTQHPAAGALADAITEYARDLRRNSSGGDCSVQELEWMASVADYLDVLVKRHPSAGTVSDKDWQRALNCAMTTLRDVPITSVELDNAMQHAFGLLSLRVARTPALPAAGEVREADDPPMKWLIESLRGLAVDLLADPKTPWIGERDPKQHICWAAADRLAALTPPQSKEAGETRDLKEEMMDCYQFGTVNPASPVPQGEDIAEASLPTYGNLPWAQLGRDVMESVIGARREFKFDPSFYPGHQSPGINFNSLARIVDKYRLARPAALATMAKNWKDK